MRDDIMFIIFPGNGTTGKHFKITDDFGEEEPIKMNNNFIPELRKLGEVKFVEPPWNNLGGYLKERNSKFYYKNIDFTLDDLNIKKYCDNVYEEVKNFKGKFVLIGHSIGAYWIYYFSQKYSNRCLYNFIIDGGLYTMSKTQDKFLEDMYATKTKDALNMTEEDIQNLIKKSKEGVQKSIKKLRGICIMYIIADFERNWKKNKDSKILKVKTISFRNISEEGYFTHKYGPPDDYFRNYDKEAVYEEEFLLIENPKKYRTIYFVNHGHTPYKMPDSKEIILNTIKGYIL